MRDCDSCVFRGGCPRGMHGSPVCASSTDGLPSEQESKFEGAATGCIPRGPDRGGLRSPGYAARRQGHAWAVTSAGANRAWIKSPAYDRPTRMHDLMRTRCMGGTSRAELLRSQCIGRCAGSNNPERFRRCSRCPTMPNWAVQPRASATLSLQTQTAPATENRSVLHAALAVQTCRVHSSGACTSRAEAARVRKAPCVQVYGT